MKFPTFVVTPQINTLLKIRQNALASLEPVLCVTITTVTTDAGGLFLKISETTMKTKSFNCNAC
jgi:hypothetical protein